MKLNKKFSSVLALVLIVAMLLPNAAFAAVSTGELVGTEKAKMEWLYLKENPSAGPGEFAYTVADPAAEDVLQVDDTFYIGLYVSKLNNIKQAELDLKSIGVTLNFNAEYLRMEPDYNNKSGKLDQTKALEAIGTRMDYADSLWNIYDWEGSLAEKNFGIGSSVQFTSPDDSANGIMKFSFDYLADASATTETSTFKGDKDFWICVVKFKVKKVPEGTDGLKVFELPDTKGAIALRFGSADDYALYDWYASSESETTASKTCLNKVMDFSMDGVDVFPATYGIVYDENVTGHTPALTPTMGTDGDLTVKAGQTISALRSGSATAADSTSWAVTSWTTTPEGGTTITPGTTVITDAMINTDTDSDGVNDTLTLYAQWEQKMVFKLDPNGGTFDDSTTAVKTILVPTSATSLSNGGETVPTVTRTVSGTNPYTFQGWYAATEGTDGTLYYVADPTHLRGADKTAAENYDITGTGGETWFAAWEVDPEVADEKTVTFDPNGGTPATTQQVTVNSGDSINNGVADDGMNMPLHPTAPAGYVFNGWNTQANGSGDAFTGKTAVTADTTVYAQWTADPENPLWTVTFHPNAADATVAPKEYKVPQSAPTITASQIPTATRTGYVPTEWRIATGGSGDTGWTADMTDSGKYIAGTTITGNIDVVPVWEQAVTLKLHPNDSKGLDPATDPDMLTITAYNGKPLTVSPDYDENDINSNRTGNYELLGWSTVSQWNGGKTWDEVLADSSAVTIEAANIATTNVDADTMGNKDFYAWWQLVVTPVETGALTYTGADQTWDDALAAKAVVFNTNATGDGDPVTLQTGAAADYTVEIYATTHVDPPEGSADPAHTDTATTAFKAAKDYCVHFKNVNPEITFDPENVLMSVAPATVKLKVEPTVDPTNEDPDAPPTLPKIEITLGDDTDPLDPEVPAEKAVIDAILKELNFVYYRLTDETSVDSGETIAVNLADNYNATKSNPYLAGNYVVAMQPGADCGYKLAATDGFALTDSSKALNYTTSAPKLATAWGADERTGLGDNPNAFLLHVEANSRTVTFKNSTDAGTLNTLADYASVTVKNNSAISDTESNPGVTMPGDPTKFDNLEFQGWFIVDKNADVNKLHEAAFAKYEAWKAITDDTPNAAEERAKLKFTADSIVSDNLTVVAVWTASEDSGLKDPDPDAVPADHVGGLKLATKNSEAETPTYVDITQFYKKDYTEEKDFEAGKQPAPDATGDALEVNRYYVRVANDQDKLKITLETNEPNSKVTVEKVAIDPDTKAETHVADVMAESDNKTKEDITLDVAVKGSANIYKIVVTAPDRTSESTYYVYVQRMAKAEIKLAYGNSPYGLIMNDPYVNTANSAYGKTDAEIKTWQDTAKTEFAKEDSFLNDDYRPVGVGTRTYLTKAWAEAWDADLADDKVNDPEVNLDRNETAIFVYNKSNFVDPGFTAINSLGETVEAKDVTRSISFERIGDSLGALTAPTADSWSGSPEDAKCEYTEITSVNKDKIRPGVYKMVYSFVDLNLTDPANDGDGDGTPDQIVSVTRYVVVLNILGDVDNNELVDLQDRTPIISLTFGGTIPYYRYANLYAYRVADVDGNGLIDLQDRTPVISMAFGGKVEGFYPALQKPATPSE